MSNNVNITTPKGTIIKTSSGTAKLEWNPGFSDKWCKQYNVAQCFVDSEVLALSAPYIPMQSTMLMLSGKLGTEVGSGLVQYIAPYAQKQYYDTSDTRSYDALRGGHWFERMKADFGKQIIAGAKLIAGGTK